MAEPTTEMEVSTRDRVVELLNQAAFLPTEKEKIANLSKVQELIIHQDPTLLDSFFEEVAAFQNDRNSDVRKFVVVFIEEACKKDPAMLPRLVPNIQLLMSDEAVAVVKRVVQAAAHLHRNTLSWLAAARTVTPEMEQVWGIMNTIKSHIITLIDHDNDGVRTQAIKFLESLVLVQTYPEADSTRRDGEFNLDQVPITLKVARPRKLEEEARMVLDKLIDFQGSIHISSVNLITCMSSLTIISRARPQFMGKVIQALEILHASLPPTLTKSQVNSVRKHLKIQLLNLLKHTAAYDYHENITTVLNDLGITANEVNKAMPSREEIKKRIRRDRQGIIEDQEEKKHKKPRLSKKIKSEQPATEEEEEEEEIEPSVIADTAVDITQKWLVSKLDIETVANIVMVNMLNLPEAMPPLFAIGYSPVTQAGSDPQIQHVSRLLSAQLTKQGLGPGAEQNKPQEASNQMTVDSDGEDDTRQTISSLASGPGQKQQIESMIPLQPAGVASRPSGRKMTKTVKLSEVTKPMTDTTSAKMQLMLMKRLLHADKTMLYSGAQKNRLRILIMLSGSLESTEKEEFEDYILEDMHNNADLFLSWLYSEHSISHDFSQLNQVLSNTKQKKDNPEHSYVDIISSVLKKALAKTHTKDREEFLLRLFLESPSVPDTLLSSLLSVGTQGSEATLSVVRLLKDVGVWRPLLMTPAIKVMATLLTHEKDQVRLEGTPHLVELCTDEKIRDVVMEVATDNLKHLLLEKPPEAIASHYLGRPTMPSEWTESAVKACLYLYLAILPLNQALIQELAQVYVKTVNEAKRAILRLLEEPICNMGMDSPELLTLVETCPKGGETLITRIIHILTEKAPPSEALVSRVRELYNRRVSDVRFLIPVLTGLSKKEVIAVLPKLIKLNPYVVKEVFNRLWGVTLDTGSSPLTPVDLLVALHLIDNEKCDVKTVIKATGLCFAERNIYTGEVLAVVLQQLMEQPQLPTLFMRTVIQTLAHYPKLLGFVMNILTRLIAKQVWKQRKVWEGFIKCCQRAVSSSTGGAVAQLLLQLPPPQLADVFTTAPDLHSELLKYLDTFTETQRAAIPTSILEVIETKGESITASDETSIPTEST